MAELNLTIRYNYLPARVVFIGMMTTLPVWEVAAPIAIGYIISQVVAGPNSIPFSLVVVLIPFLLLFIALCIAITGCAEDNRFYLSKDGISFPPFFLPYLRGRRARQWGDLLSAHIAQGQDGSATEKARLFLTFKDGALIRLDLSCFVLADLEQLLLSIELWGNLCKRSDELISYQSRIQNRVQGISSRQPGYTQMWEDELGRRFQATSFVPLEPGHPLLQGRLKIIRQLAFGGLSAIYLAQENQGNLVVLKEAVVPPNAEPQIKAEAEHLLYREAEILSLFQHPRVARVLDHFVAEGRHYLKLEYINGTDLRQYVKQHGPLNADLALNWGIQILEVVQALHSQSPPILHRDLTPENLVLSKGEIKLIDFGAANQYVGSATGTIVGKQSYMPPEQLRGKAVIASDLYAFGGTMHFLLTGRDPLPLSLAHPAILVKQLPVAIDAVIAKCTAFEPEDRYQSASEILQELQQLKPGVKENITEQRTAEVEA